MSFSLGLTRQNRWGKLDFVHSLFRKITLLAIIKVVKCDGINKISELRIFMSLSLILFCNYPNANAQNLALKTNMLYDVLSVPSLGGEVAMGKHFSASLMCTYNPIRYGDKKWKNFSFQPEMRYWFHRKFTGPFVGANMIWGGFNVDKMHPYGLYGKHRQGHFVGAGIDVGYNLILSNRCSIEFTLGADYVHAKFERFREGDSPYKEGDFSGNTVLPTGTGVTFVYIIK
jgi:hypothetical protein